MKDHRKEGRELIFVEYKLDAYTAILRSLLHNGHLRIVLKGLGKENNIIKDFLMYIKNNHLPVSLYTDEDFQIDSIDIRYINDINKADAIFLFCDEANALSNHLIRLRYLKRGVICAPVTAHYCEKRPVFSLSVPKSGTYLLDTLLTAMGFIHDNFSDIPEENRDLKPGHYYPLRHILPDFMCIDYIKAPSLLFTFLNSVTVMIYRDPRDVIVSWANYIPKDWAYQFHHIDTVYMKGLSPEKRISALINGDYPIPIYLYGHKGFYNMRELLLSYYRWLKYPLQNLVPIKFEDLIGPNGGGSYEKQIDTIWLLQLALHRPGRPEDFAGKVFSRSSPTFRKGRIGSYLEEFTDVHVKEFLSMPQDFMEYYGYAKKIKIIKPFTLWLTGPSFPGKTTIAQAIHKEFCLSFSRGLTILDDRDIRQHYPEDSEYSRRDTHIRNIRIAKKARDLYRQNKSACVNTISPYKDTRNVIRNMLKDFIEVYVKPPASIYEQGNSVKECEDLIKPLPEVYYEEPENAEIVLDTDKLTVKQCVERILAYLVNEKYISIWTPSTYPGQDLSYFTGSMAIENEVPVSVEEDFYGYRIIIYKNLAYAISREIQHMDIRYIDEKTLKEYKGAYLVIVDKHLHSLKERVREITYIKTQWMGICDSIDGLINYLEQQINISDERIYDFFMTILSKINTLKGTIINDIAVMQANRGNIDMAEALLEKSINEGYCTETIEKNLTILKKLKKDISGQVHSISQ